MGAAWMNLASLALGCLAWALPLAALVLKERLGRPGCALCAAGSFAACGAALWLQILYNRHLVRIEDFSALLDTVDAVAFLSGLLLAGTLAANGLLFAVCAREKREHK